MNEELLVGDLVLCSFDGSASQFLAKIETIHYNDIYYDYTVRTVQENRLYHLASSEVLGRYISPESSYKYSKKDKRRSVLLRGTTPIEVSCKTVIS